MVRCNQNPGKWKLYQYNDFLGNFDFVVIAHNGKCADKLMSTAGKLNDITCISWMAGNTPYLSCFILFICISLFPFSFLYFITDVPRIHNLLKVNFGDTLPPVNRMRKMQLCSLWVTGKWCSR